MITKEQAKKLHWHDIVHYGQCSKIIGKRGKVTIKSSHWRVNGKCKTWVTMPDRFILPLKFGLYGYGHMCEDNANEFHLASECNLND